MNGTTNRDSIEKLRLSDAFMQEDANHEFEWTATMINLNQGKNEALLEKCKVLDVLSDEEISRRIKLPLETVQRLRKENE